MASSVMYGLKLGNSVNAKELHDKSSVMSHNIKDSQKKSRATRNRETVHWKHSMYKENFRQRKTEDFYPRNKFFLYKSRQAFGEFKEKVSTTDMIHKNKVKYWRKNHVQSKTFKTHKDCNYVWKRNKDFHKNYRKKKITKSSSRFYDIIQDSWLNYKTISNIKSPIPNFRKKNLTPLKSIDDLNNNSMIDSKSDKSVTVAKSDVSEETRDSSDNSKSVESAEFECKDVNSAVEENSEDDVETVIFDEKEFTTRNIELEEIELKLKEIAKKRANKSNTLDTTVIQEDTQSAVKVKRKEQHKDTVLEEKVTENPKTVSVSNSETNVEESSMSHLEDDLSEVCRLVKQLHEAHRIIVQLIHDMPKNTELADHFRTVIKTQQENFRKDIWKNQEAIMKGYDKMVNDCKNPSRVASEIGKRTRLTVEEVHSVISRCIFVESTCERQTLISEKTVDSENNPVVPSSVYVNTSCSSSLETWNGNNNSDLSTSSKGVASGSAVVMNTGLEENILREESAVIANLSDTGPPPPPLPPSYAVPFRGNYDRSLAPTQRQEVPQIPAFSQNPQTPHAPYVYSKGTTEKTSLELLLERFSYPRQDLQVQTQYPPNVSLPRDVPRVMDHHFSNTACCVLPPASRRRHEVPYNQNAAPVQRFPLTNQRPPPYYPPNQSIPPNRVLPPEMPPPRPLYLNSRLSCSASFQNQPPQFTTGVTNHSNMFPGSNMRQVPVGDSAQSVCTMESLNGDSHLRNILMSSNLPLRRPVDTTEPNHSPPNISFDRVARSEPNGFLVSSSIQHHPVEQNHVAEQKTPTEPPDPTVPQKLTMKNHRLEAGDVLEPKSTKEEDDSDSDELEVLKEVIHTREVKKPKVDNKTNAEAHIQLSRSYVCARNNCKKRGVQICDGCRSVIYCSDSCQLIHWTNKHVKECRKLKELRG